MAINGKRSGKKARNDELTSGLFHMKVGIGN
jgi:hypothetical protein